MAVLAPLVATVDAAPAAAPIGWAPGAYVPLRTFRLLNTASGVGAPKLPVAGLSAIALQVTGRGSVPVANVGAVVLNVTAVAGTKTGSVVVYPHGSRRPNTVHVRYEVGAPVANLVTVPVGTGGTVDLFNLSRGTVQLSADVVGYYVAGTPSVVGGFQAIAPTRLLDTHTGRGVQSGVAGPVQALGGVQLFATGRAPVPADGVGTVVLNVTVSASTAAGSLTIFPNETLQPKTMSVSFGVGQTVSSHVTVRLGTYEALSVVNNSLGSVHVTVDLVGWFVSQFLRRDVLPAAANGMTIGVDPVRVYQSTSATPIPANGVKSVKVLGQRGVPATGVSAVVVSLTEVKAVASGSLVAHASGTPAPGVANLFFSAGRRVTNSAIVPVGSDGSITVVNRSAGPTQVMVVVVAYVRHLPVSINPVSTGQSGWAMLQLLSCPTVSFCATVDQFGNALTFDGATWSARRHVMAASALSCSGPTFCMAVGASEYAVFDGRSWSASLGGAPFTPTFLAVSCSSETRCVAVVSGGQLNTSAISLWNGSVWTSPITAPHVVASLDCVTDSWCMAVGGGKASALVGNTWASAPEVSTLADSSLKVSCGAVDACTVVTPTSQLAVLDASGWHDGISFSARPLRDVSCADEHACYLATDQAVIQIDGLVQTGSFPPVTAIGTDLSCPSATRCVSTLADGSVVSLTSGVWSDPVRIDPEGGVTNVTCVSAISCAAVTDGATVTWFDGGRWSAPSPLPTPSAAAIRRYSDIACTSPVSCTAVGASGAVATFDGSAWTLDNGAPSDSFTSVSCPAEARCVAAANSAVSVVDHGTWSRVGFPVLMGSSYVDCATVEHCVLVGAGKWSAFDGVAWSSPSDLGLAATAIDCVGASWCLAVGASGGVGTSATFDGTSWVTGQMPMQATSVSCTSAAWCAAVDDTGRLSTFDGSSWSAPLSIASFGTRYRVECVATGKCVVGGA